MAYMKNVFETLHGWGAEMFKTDFMLWGLQDSSRVKRHMPGKTSVEYFREYLQMIREAIGEESYWLGCIAPFLPFVGYADGMRIGGDVGSSWDGEFGPQNMMRCLAGNHYTNHHYYQTDPDAVMLKQERLIGKVAPHTNRKEQLMAEELHVVRNQKDTVFRMLQPEKQILRLSDAFEKETAEPELELKVLMLNINFGHNQELMEKCRTLKEYAQYVDRVRKYAKRMQIEEAVERAVTECIREGILADFLSSQRAEVIAVSIFEYNEEEEMRKIRDSEYKSGKEDGIAQGIACGEAEAIISLIRKKIRKRLRHE